MKNRDFPVRYVSLPEGTHIYSPFFLFVPYKTTISQQFFVINGLPAGWFTQATEASTQLRGSTRRTGPSEAGVTGVGVRADGEILKILSCYTLGHHLVWHDLYIPIVMANKPIVMVASLVYVALSVYPLVN
jgi:hypothetical protein